MVVYEKKARLEVDPTLDIRTLTPAYAELVASHYSHPEYLAPGELEVILARGLVLGGFEAGRLCAFIGEHPEGAIGMLEVFPEQRRRGWATALESAKINEQLDRGLVPWGEVWPDNQASIALQEKLGLTVYAHSVIYRCQNVTAAIHFSFLSQRFARHAVCRINDAVSKRLQSGNNLQKDW